jgi:hypothetical protein
LDLHGNSYFLLTILEMLRRTAMRANSTLDSDYAAQADDHLERDSRLWNEPPSNSTSAKHDAFVPLENNRGLGRAQRLKGSVQPLEEF